MPELLRTVEVTITVDTNRHQTLTWQEDETLGEFEARVVAALDELTEVA